MRTKWTLVLFALIAFDSWSTAYIFQAESNIIFLWLMEKFNLTLGQMMFARVFYYIPLLYLLDRLGGEKWTSLTVVLYVAIYLIFWISSI